MHSVQYDATKALVAVVRVFDAETSLSVVQNPKFVNSSVLLVQCSASNIQSGGLDERCGLQKVLHVAPQMLLQRCSMGHCYVLDSLTRR